MSSLRGLSCAQRVMTDMDAETLRRLAILKAEVSRLEDVQRQEQLEAKRRHDNMIGAAFHALKAIMQIRDAQYSGRALSAAQAWSGSSAGYREDGDYNIMRRKMYHWLVDLDLIDGVTQRFIFRKKSDGN